MPSYDHIRKVPAVLVKLTTFFPWLVGNYSTNISNHNIEELQYDLTFDSNLFETEFASFYSGYQQWICSIQDNVARGVYLAQPFNGDSKQLIDSAHNFMKGLSSYVRTLNARAQALQCDPNQFNEHTQIIDALLVRFETRLKQLSDMTSCVWRENSAPSSFFSWRYFLSTIEKRYLDLYEKTHNVPGFFGGWGLYYAMKTLSRNSQRMAQIEYIQQVASSVECSSEFCFTVAKQLGNYIMNCECYGRNSLLRKLLLNACGSAELAGFRECSIASLLSVSLDSARSYPRMPDAFQDYLQLSQHSSDLTAHQRGNRYVVNR